MQNINQEARERQERFLASQEMEAASLDLIVAEAFTDSIRSLGYRNAATASHELIDNSIEATARNVHVVFGFGSKSDNKPTDIAFIDDGHGMLPEMIRAAVKWGGTDRHGSRNLFGRYGFGLPSASVSQGKAFTVYSRMDDGAFHSVTIDLDDLASGAYRGEDGRTEPPAAVEAGLPPWVVEHVASSFDGGVAEVRTVVVWSKLDSKLTWVTASKLQQKMLEHFGVTYRGFLREVHLQVNGIKVEAIDPLFTTPTARFYKQPDDGQTAEELPPAEIKVTSQVGKPEGTIRVRMSFMPYGFLSKDKTKRSAGKNANSRLGIRKENNGIAVCRNGRQIDVVNPVPLTTFLTNDRYVGIEIDFDATLDDEFGITTAKQQITISDRIWDALRTNGVPDAIEALRRRWDESRGDVLGQQDVDQDQVRPSEAVMAEREQTQRDVAIPPEREKEALCTLEKASEEIASTLGKEIADVMPEVVEANRVEAEARPWLIKYEDAPGGSFYRPAWFGLQKVVYLNRKHRFFTEVYSPLGGSDGLRLRAGLELLLFALADAEIVRSTVERQAFYEAERWEWSKEYSTLLLRLGDHVESFSEPDEFGFASGDGPNVAMEEMTEAEMMAVLQADGSNESTSGESVSEEEIA